MTARTRAFDRRRAGSLVLWALSICAAACASGTTHTQEPRPVVAVAGDLPSPNAFDAAWLETLGPEDVAHEHDGVTCTYRGVTLARVLAACGFTAGPGGRSLAPSARRPGWSKVVIALGSDGHQAVFSCAELDPDLGSTRSFLVWQVDGGPLAPDEGPFRLITTTDRRGFRSVRQLVQLDVVDVRDRQQLSQD